jgi:CRP-like cAMP-binding protein
LELRIGDSLHCCGGWIENIIFPNSGLVTMTVPLREVAGAGVALVGRESIVGGFAAVSCAPASCDAEVQVPGTALRMPVAAFRHALEQSSAVRSLAARFDSAMLAHAQQTARAMPRTRWNREFAVVFSKCRIVVTGTKFL